MIEPEEVRRLGNALAQLHARYSTSDLEQVLHFAFKNRIKGGALPGLSRLLKKFAAEIQIPLTNRRHRPRETAPSSRYGNR